MIEKIIFIADPEVLAIPIEECCEPLIDCRHDDVLWYGPTPECEETKCDYTKMRKAVYDKVLRAQEALPDGLRFRLYEAFRSRSVQKMLYDLIYRQTVERLPGASKEELFHETTRLVSPVVNLDGTDNIPVHNTGAAVDIEIVDGDGSVIDMGMESKDWCNVAPDLCRTDYEQLPAHIKLNRKLLHDVMVAQGFVNYPTEWWHFSYGDRYWALLTGADHAIYGPADSM